MNILMALIFLLFDFFPNPAEGSAHCQPQPDYWFLETYHAETDSLPETISIAESPRHVARGYFQIENHADAPVYVLPIDANAAVTVTETPSVSGEMLTEENPPGEQLLIENVPSLAVYVIGSNNTLRLDIDTLPKLVPYIEERNVLEVDRPGFVSLPLTQRGQFHLVYQEQLLTIPFTISYALNQDFSPGTCESTTTESKAQEIEFVNSKRNTYTNSIVTLVIFIVLVAAASLWIRQQRGKHVG